jgi:hypothetical protein
VDNYLYKINEDIENCREEMVRLASKTSLANSLVIETSKRLDSLLNKYHLLNQKH